MWKLARWLCGPTLSECTWPTWLAAPACTPLPGADIYPQPWSWACCVLTAWASWLSLCPSSHSLLPCSQLILHQATSWPAGCLWICSC